MPIPLFSVAFLVRPYVETFAHVREVAFTIGKTARSSLVNNGRPVKFNLEGGSGIDAHGLYVALKDSGQDPFSFLFKQSNFDRPKFVGVHE